MHGGEGSEAAPAVARYKTLAAPERDAIIALSRDLAHSAEPGRRSGPSCGAGNQAGTATEAMIGRSAAAAALQPDRWACCTETARARLWHSSSYPSTSLTCARYRAIKLALGL